MVCDCVRVFLYLDEYFGSFMVSKFKKNVMVVEMFFLVFYYLESYVDEILVSRKLDVIFRVVKKDLFILMKLEDLFLLDGWVVFFYVFVGMVVLR